MGCRISRGDFFFLSRVLSSPTFLFLLYGPQVNPFFYSPFLSSCRMARGHEGVSTSQAGRRKGTPRETPTVSSLVVAMFAEELRLYIQIPPKISLETSDSAIISTLGESNNAAYFTWEQFVVRLRLPIPSLVKQFLHFTRAPPTLIHPNAFWILMGCSVLNSLYHLGISLVEICFIYI